DEAIYSEALYARYHFDWSELVALTDPRYRYIKAPHDELYDLDRDPRERQNIASERTQTRDALRGALDRLVSNAVIQPPAAIDADARARLQALGYLGAAGALLARQKLPEAAAHAQLAAKMASEHDNQTRANAHALLAKIALARRDADAARSEAQLAHQADSLLPAPAFVEGRL